MEGQEEQSMALMLGSLYQALRSVEVPDDKAKAAAEEVASYENKLTVMDGKIDRLAGRVDLLTWMVGTNIAVTFIVLGKVLLS
jgi:hypothetical protein